MNDLRNKLVSGIDLAVKRLIEKKRQSDGMLVYSKDGKIVKVKAKDLKIK